MNSMYGMIKSKIDFNEHSRKVMMVKEVQDDIQETDLGKFHNIAFRKICLYISFDRKKNLYSRNTGTSKPNDQTETRI